jgi:hypothetical protein
MAILTLGLARLSLIRSDGSFWTDVVPASVIAAAGETAGGDRPAD